ncbi:hypothetical protein GTY23_41245, partial [Streptomyces sp. SID5998]|nr:hypothetical protein [Streptomyces sp. SID5998]
APDRLARLAGVDDGAVETALRTLGSVGLVAGLTFRHDIVRQAVVDDLAPEDRTTLRLAAAALLHEQGCPPRAIAPLLVEA